MSESRVAVVTGASKGLGRSISLELARKGYDPVLVARSRAELDSLASEIRELGRRPVVLPADVTRSGDLRDVAQGVEREFGRLDLLVNNAGIEQHSPLESLPEEEFDRLVLVNLKGVFLALQAFVPLLARTPGASIVNVASAAGLVGMPLAAAYGATKAAVIHLTRALAVEWRRHGIRINCVCPGFIDTDMAHRGLESFRKSGFPVDMLVAYRQGRLGKPDEVAQAVAFLASVESGFVNGHALAVDGGASVN
jgi:NAD(P)-dependent dehydrogenase (short-subunit alcohol dehydrogenase family)